MCTLLYRETKYIYIVFTFCLHERFIAYEQYFYTYNSSLLFQLLLTCINIKSTTGKYVVEDLTFALNTFTYYLIDCTYTQTNNVRLFTISSTYIRVLILNVKAPAQNKTLPRDGVFI